MHARLTEHRNALIAAGSRPLTAANAITALAAICRHMGIEPDELTEDTFAAYATTRDLLPGTVGTYRSYVRRYVRWATTGDLTYIPPGTRQKWAISFASWYSDGEYDGTVYAEDSGRQHAAMVGMVARSAGVHPRHLTRQHAHSFLRARDRAGCSYPYLNSIARALELWGQFARIGELAGLPRRSESKRRNPQRPRPVDNDLLQAMIGAATPAEHAMIILGTQCGMRAFEIGKARGRDFKRDGAAYQVRIQGKYGTRYVLISAEAYAGLAPVIPADGGRLFPFLPEKQRPAAVRVNDILSALATRSGGSMTSHQLRHWFASTAWAVTGKDLFAVRDLMGHKDVGVTQAYIAALTSDGSDVAQAMAAALPAGGAGPRPLRVAS